METSSAIIGLDYLGALAGNRLGLELHCLLAALDGPVAAPGDDELGTAFGADIAFACLVSHGGRPPDSYIAVAPI